MNPERAPIAGFIVFLAGALASVVVVEPAPVDLLLVALSGWWIVRGEVHISKAAAVAGMLYVSMSAISQLIGGLNGVEFNSAVVRDLGIETYLVVMTLCVTAKFQESPKSMERFVQGLVAGAVIVSAGFLVLQAMGNVPDVLYRDEHRVRVSGLFKDPNVLGPFLVLPSLLLLFRNEIIRIRFARLLALPCLIVLGMTYSRGAYVGLLVALAIAMVAALMRERITYTGALLGVATMFGLAVAATFMWSTAGLPAVEVNTNRLSYQAYDNDRFSTLASAFDYILEHPFGNGVRAFADDHGSNPHNLFLGKATDAGIAAGAMVVAIPLAASLRALLSRWTAAPRFSMLVGATLLGNMVVSGVIYAHHWRHLFFLTALAFAVSTPERLKRQNHRTIDLTADAVDLRLRAQSLGGTSR